MNMAEEAICGQNTQEFVELLANQYQSVSGFMESVERLFECHVLDYPTVLRICISFREHSGWSVKIDQQVSPR